MNKEKIAAPVVAGLVTGAAFVFLIGFVANFPSGFVVSVWNSDIVPIETQIPIVILQRSELEKYHPELEEGINHIDSSKPHSTHADPSYQTWIMGYEARQLMRNLPFVEMSHEDQNFRGYYVIIKVIHEESQEEKQQQYDYNYLLSIHSIKPGKLFDY